MQPQEQATYSQQPPPAGPPYWQPPQQWAPPPPPDRAPSTILLILVLVGLMVNLGLTLYVFFFVRGFVQSVQQVHQLFGG